MKRELRGFRFPAMLAAALLFAANACQKTKPQEQQVAPIDRVGPSPLESRQTVLHKSFAVRTTVAFPFEIPAHAAMPRLRGNYKSFVSKVGIQPDENSANVDFFIVTEDQYADFARNSEFDSIFSVDASHDQNVDVNIPPSLNEPKKFYLIFRNTPGGDAKKIVQADLTVDF